MHTGNSRCWRVNTISGRLVQVAANNVRLAFAASDAVAIQPLLPAISQFITERIEQVRKKLMSVFHDTSFQTICPTFHSELVPVISNRLLNTPLRFV